MLQSHRWTLGLQSRVFMILSLSLSCAASRFSSAVLSVFSLSVLTYRSMFSWLRTPWHSIVGSPDPQNFVIGLSCPRHVGLLSPGGHKTCCPIAGEQSRAVQRKSGAVFMAAFYQGAV